MFLHALIPNICIYGEKTQFRVIIRESSTIPLENSTHYFLYLTGDILPFLRSERDLDLESRDGVASMSSSTSEASDWSELSDWNLFPVGIECCLLCTAAGEDCLLSLTLFFLLFIGEDGLSVSVLADLVGTDGFFIS